MMYTVQIGYKTDRLCSRTEKVFAETKEEAKKWFGKWFWLKIQAQYLLMRTQEKEKGAANNRSQKKRCHVPRL